MQKPQDDLFGRAKYAQELASSIVAMNAAEGFVIGLNGPWGSGKTSFLNFVLGHIETAKDKVAVVRFNPWWFSGRENLLMGFFDEFRAALGKRPKTDSLRKIGPLLESFGGYFTQFNGFSGAALRLIGAVARSVEQKDLRQIRAQIDDALRKQRKRILVVIDDIDRLQAEEIRQIFSLIKAVTNFPQTIYLLCFDQTAVARALDGVQQDKGEKYIEKIVQLPVELPMLLRSQLHEFLNSQLQEVIFPLREGKKWDDYRWHQVFWDGFEPFLRTPREVNRLINSLACAYPVIAPEVDPVDFIGVHALKMMAPDMHRFVMENKIFLIEGKLFSSSDPLSSHSALQDEKRKFAEQSLTRFVQENQRKMANALMGNMFPRWNELFGGMRYSGDHFSMWRRQRRICVAECFDKYFALIVPPGAISTPEMEDILMAAGDDKKFGSTLLRLKEERGLDGKTKLRQFLGRMLDYAESSIPDNHIKAILSVLFDKGDNFIIEGEAEGIFEFDNKTLMGQLLFRFLERIEDKKERFNILRNAMSEGAAIFFIVSEVMVLGQQHGKYLPDNYQKSANDPLITLPDQEKLEDIALRKIRKAISNGTLSAAPKLAAILYRLIDWGNKDEALHYVSNLIKNDKGLCDFLVGFLGYVKSGEGNYHAISLDSVAKFVDDYKLLLPRCEKILNRTPKWLNDKRKVGLKVFVDTVRGKLRSLDKM